MALNETSYLNLAERVNPKEASDFIQEAEKRKLHPDGYVDLQKEIKEQEEISPVKTSNVVARSLAKSDQHKAVMKNDIDKFNWFDRYVRLTGDVLTGKDLSGELFKLQYKKVTEDIPTINLGEFTPQDDIDVTNLNVELRELNGGREEYEYDFAQTLPAEMIGGVYDFGKMLWRGRDLTLTGGTAGAVGGAIVGAPGGPVVAGLGAGIGALKGSLIGTGVGLVRDTFQQSTGQIYNDLSYVLKDGQQLPESEKKSLALGGGMAMALVSVIPIGTIAARTPFVRNFASPRILTKYLLSPQGGPLRELLKSMAYTGTAEAFEEGAQEYIQTIATEMGKTWDGTETSFIEGLANATSVATAEKAGKAAIIGGLTGATIQGGLSTVGGVVEGAIGRQAPLEAPPERDVTPEVPLLPPGPSDLSTETAGVPTSSKGVAAIQLKVAIDQSVQLTQDTDTNQNLPVEMDEIRQGMWERSGNIPTVWLDKEELNAWADSDEKAAKVRNILDLKGFMASELNSPLRVEMHKFMRIAEDHPEITDLVKSHPEGPSAQQQLDALEKANKSRKVVTEELPGQDPLFKQPMTSEVEEQLAERIESYEIAVRADEEGLRQTKQALEEAEDPATRQTLQQEIDRLSQRIEGSLARLQSLRDYGEGVGDFAPTAEDILGEVPFLEQPTFTENTRDVIPEEEATRRNDEQLRVRNEIIEAIPADKDLEMENVVNLNDRFNQVVENEEVRSKFETEDKINTVEDFLRNNRIFEDDANEYQKERIKKKLPVHSIDPESLDEHLRKEFEKDPRLKKRKVFVKDGESIENVMTIYGFTSQRDVLETLANTPTKQQQININKKLADSKKKVIERRNSKYEKSKIAKGYEKLSKTHFSDMKFLTNKYWPVARPNIQKPSIDYPALRTKTASKAKEDVGSLKVKELNVNQWKVGERKSQRLAVKAIESKNVEEMQRQKKNAAYNALMSKETHIAVGKTNRAFQFITSLEDIDIKNELKEAGKEFVEAKNFVLDVWNLNPAYNGKANVTQYNKFVKRMQEEGRGDFEITEEQMEWIEAQEDPNDYTVDQLLFLEDYLKRILYQARKEDVFLREDEKRRKEVVKEFLHEKALENPDYKEGREPEDLGALNVLERTKGIFDLSETLIKNNQFIYQQIDRKLGGPYAQILHFPITGAGRYEGPTGLIAWGKLMRTYKVDIAKKIEKHYGDQRKLLRYSGDYVTVPEFKNLPNFKKSKGKVSKAQLLMLLLNMGNAGNRARIENYGISADVVMTVLKRELTKADFEFAQSIWNIFKGLAPRLNAVHRSQTGQDLDFVQQESFTAFDKVFEGGYFPILLRRRGALRLAKELYDDLKEMNDPTKATNVFFKHPAYEGIVRSPHTKKRTGTNEVLDLDFNGFSRSLDDMIYDITMREPLRDVVGLLKDKDIRRDIINQVGYRKYNTLINNLALLSKSITANNNRIHSESQQLVQGLASNLQGWMALAYIGFNPNSVIMSALALPNIRLKMGTKNYYRYGANTALKVMGAIASGNFNVFKEMFNLAADIDPSLQFYASGINDARIDIGNNILPKERLITVKGYNAFANFRERMAEWAFSGILGNIDTAIKMVTTISVYNMYINGDAKGHSYESVHSGKTPQEIHQDAKAYVSQFLEGTTMRALRHDKAVLQNVPFGPLVTAFWNESRSHINNVIQSSRDINRDGRLMLEAAKRKDYDEASQKFNDSAAQTGNLFLYLLTMKAMLSFATYGVFFLMDNEEDEPYAAADNIEKGKFTEDQLKKFPQWVGEQVTPSGLYGVIEDVVFGNAPFIRDFTFAFKADRGNRVPRYSVSIPVMATVTDFKNAAVSGIKMYGAYQDGYLLQEAFEGLSPKERRAIFNSTGYLLGGFPGTNQFEKLYKYFVLEEHLTLPRGDFLLKNFIKNTDKVLKKNKPKDEFERLWDKSEGKGETEAEQFYRQLEEYKNKIAPIPKGNPISDDAYEIIKYTESKGVWNIRPESADEDEDAFGLYQFREEAWIDVVNSPEGKAAGITMSSRFSKNPKYQEAAMRIYSKLVAKKLAEQGVPINIETIYFGHHFSTTAVTRYAKDIFLGPEKKRLPKGFLTSGIKGGNKWTRGPRTNGEFRKSLRRLLKRGEQIMLERKR